MMDMEKVIEGLERAKKVIEDWIPIFEQRNSPFTIDCAIELLKQQKEDLDDLMKLLKFPDLWEKYKNQPEIVRCKECKRGARLERTGMMPMVTCKGEDHDLDWFCADGERKDD